MVADWSGNKTFIMDFDWAQGRVGDKRQIADVEYPTNFQMTEDRIILLSLVCCQLEDFIKMTIYDVAGNLVTSTTTLPSGDRILAPQDVAVDPQVSCDWLRAGHVTSALPLFGAGQHPAV